MSELENRLRDAYLGATDTVTPGSIRGLGEPVTRLTWGARRTRHPGRSGLGRVLAPVGAAAAVVAVVVLAAVLLRPGPGTGMAPGVASAEPKFLITTTTGVSPLQVRNAATGVVVAQVKLPIAPGRNVGRTYIGAVATANGHNYLVSTYQNPCRSWVYQFQLNDQGQPSAVTAFAALPTIGSQLSDLTVSGNGQMVGFGTDACMGAKQQPNYVGVINLRTHRTTRWTLPTRNALENLSLTADGGLLSYSLQLAPSVIGVIPTSAAPGSAATRGRIVVQASQSGSSEWISFAALSPDGSAVYYSIYSETGGGPQTGQIRVRDLATGRTRVVSAPAGQPGLITADPSLQHMLLQVQAGRDSLQLVRLDLATGRISRLPSAWIQPTGAVITW